MGWNYGQAVTRESKAVSAKSERGFLGSMEDDF